MTRYASYKSRRETWEKSVQQDKEGREGVGRGEMGRERRSREGRGEKRRKTIHRFLLPPPRHRLILVLFFCLLFLDQSFMEKIFPKCQEILG